MQEKLCDLISRRCHLNHQLLQGSIALLWNKATHAFEPLRRLPLLYTVVHTALELLEIMGIASGAMLANSTAS